MRILSVLFALLSVSCVANARRKSVLFVDPSITSANLSRRIESEASGRPGAALQPALTYAKMSAEECKTALKARSISYVEESYAPGVLAPIRLSGTIRGIRYHSQPSLNAIEPRLPSKCSTAALFSRSTIFPQMLRQAGVVEVVHYSVFRPNKKHPGAGSKHAGALAIDVGTLVR